MPVGLHFLDGGGLEFTDGHGLVTYPVDCLELDAGELIVDEVLHVEVGGVVLGLLVDLGFGITLEVGLVSAVVGEGEVILEEKGDLGVDQALVLKADGLEERDLERIFLHFEAVVVLGEDVEDELLVLVLVADGDGLDVLQRDAPADAELILKGH